MKADFVIPANAESGCSSPIGWMTGFAVERRFPHPRNDGLLVLAVVDKCLREGWTLPSIDA